LPARALADLTPAVRPSQEADVTQDRFVTTPFWELFEMPFAEGARPWEACRDVASRGGEFVVHGVRVAGKYERGSFTMRFRCAAGSQLADPQTKEGSSPSVYSFHLSRSCSHMNVNVSKKLLRTWQPLGRLQL
jgi:hypothetical protein